MKRVDKVIPESFRREDGVVAFVTFHGSSEVVSRVPSRFVLFVLSVLSWFAFIPGIHGIKFVKVIRKLIIIGVRI